MGSGQACPMGTNAFTGQPVVAPEDREIDFEPTIAQLAANPDAIALRDVSLQRGCDRRAPLQLPRDLASRLGAVID